MTLKNEIIHGLPFADYQAIDAINMSLLKEISDSPGRLDWRRRNPWEPTAPAILGNAIHTLLLEASEFAKRYTSPPMRMEELPEYFVEVPADMLGKSGALLKLGKEWAEDQEAAGNVPVKPTDWGEDGLGSRNDAGKAWRKWATTEGFIVIPRDMKTQAIAAALATGGYTPAMDLINASAHEVTIVWQDPETELWCKGRMDNWDDATRTEADLKTTGKSVHHEAIGRTAYLVGWHIQRAFYGMGVEAITGEPVEQHKVIAVEVDEPWRCEVYQMGEAEMELGRDKVREMLGKYAGWKAAGSWPMNSGRVLPLEFPGWAFK